MPDFPTIVGYLAATFTTAAFYPQLVHTLRTRDTSGISLGTYACFLCGLLMWLLYGILRHDPPVIVANSLSLVSASIIFTMKLRHG